MQSASLMTMIHCCCPSISLVRRTIIAGSSSLLSPSASFRRGGCAAKFMVSVSIQHSPVSAIATGMAPLQSTVVDPLTMILAPRSFRERNTEDADNASGVKRQWMTSGPKFPLHTMTACPKHIPRWSALGFTCRVRLRISCYRRGRYNS